VSRLASEPVTLAAEAWGHMRALVLDLHDRRQEACATVDLSIAKIKALRALSNEPMTMRELAARLSADPPYVTLIGDDLERRGFITRSVHPTDRRAKLVTLTDAGRDANARAQRVLAEPPAALAELPADELAVLTRVLERLVEAAPAS